MSKSSLKSVAILLSAAFIMTLLPPFKPPNSRSSPVDR